MANAHDRSKFIKFDAQAKTPVFKRSNHNDFATTTELTKKKFSGWRSNGITREAELWIEGGIVRRVTAAEMHLDPNKVEKVHAEFFGLL